VPALALALVESELEQPVVVRMVPETNPAIAAETINVLAVLVTVITFLAFSLIFLVFHSANGADRSPPFLDESLVWSRTLQNIPEDARRLGKVRLRRVRAATHYCVSIAPIFLAQSTKPCGAFLIPKMLAFVIALIPRQFLTWSISVSRKSARSSDN
jgi:hypothetical protein